MASAGKPLCRPSTTRETVPERSLQSDCSTHLTDCSERSWCCDCKTGDDTPVQFYGHIPAKQGFSPDGGVFPGCQIHPVGDLLLTERIVRIGRIDQVGHPCGSIFGTDALAPPFRGRWTYSWSEIMRALCLLALIGATLSGCCSAHRAWSEGYDACVPQCDACQAAPRKSCWFQKKLARPGCSCSSRGNPCGLSGGGCGSSCGGSFEGCSSCGEGVISDGMVSSGCASCQQGQTVYEGSMYSATPQSSTCPTCHQTHMNPEMSSPAPAYSPAESPPMTPPPMTPPAASAPMPEPAPEPHQARMLQLQQMQPLPMQPAQTQTIQYQDWQPHQSQPQNFVPYNPPAQTVPPQIQTAVQPILWVPATPPAPLLLPAR